MYKINKPCNCNEISSQTDLALVNNMENISKAVPSEPCSCTPYSLLCCCGPQNGISVIQPACQNLPDGSVVNNPAYVPSLNQSFWTYKFMTDCSTTARGISGIAIPICQLINATTLIVSEKIDGCGTFTPVDYTLTTNDPNFGTAPSGFQFVKIETDDRYDKGVTVEYRLEIVGDYPIAIQPINVKAATSIYVFDCDCFQVPQCNPEGKLSLTKTCSNTIINNQATLNYHLSVDNIGDGTLDNVQFNDVITIPTNIKVGSITVTPETLTVNTSPAGQIFISGNLSTIEAGGGIIINYTIQITGVTAPGNYVVTNIATASALNTQDSANCSTHLNVVQLVTVKCCVIEGNKAMYRFTISSVDLSPNVTIDIVDNLFIPGGITVRFTSFGDCVATFANTEEQVPLDIDITGPLRILITCNNVLVPQSGSIHKDVSFLLISSSFVGVSIIENEVESVTPTVSENQLFLGAGALPVKAFMNVELSIECTNPCS
ncbi:MAG: hypothetical protein K0S76_553 [Herbinix sp.]|jgi:hypothetical protein|nr:hypothetical protein [Herbinix sp.]